MGDAKIYAGKYFKHDEFGYVLSEYDSHFGAVCVLVLTTYRYRYVMVKELIEVEKYEATETNKLAKALLKLR